MYIVIDPGETVGIAIFSTVLRNRRLHLDLVDAFDVVSETIGDFTYRLYTQELRTHHPSEVVVEDYRIYRGKAEVHTGVRLYTAEMIGAIRGVCALFVPRIGAIVYPAQTKGAWPLAKLDKYFPRHGEYKGHCHDAIQLGLYHAETALKWDTSTGVSEV